MAYTAPPTFAHGDYPTAALLNVLSSNIVELATQLASYNPVAPELPTEGGTFINVYRWLHYRSVDGQTPTILDPTEIGSSQTLPNSTSVVSTYDLSNVSWLIPGRQYTLTGCLYAFEDWEA